MDNTPKKHIVNIKLLHDDYLKLQAKAESEGFKAQVYAAAMIRRHIRDVAAIENKQSNETQS